MNTKKTGQISRIFFIMLIIIFFLDVVAFVFPPSKNVSAAGATIKLVIVNKMPKPIRIAFRGPKTLTLTVQSGKNTVDMVPGKYSYEYYACNSTQKGTLEVKKGRGPLNIPACKISRIILVNWTSKSATFKFEGPEKASYTLGPKSHQVINLLQGTYKYTVNFCAQSVTKTVEINKPKYRAKVSGC